MYHNRSVYNPRQLKANTAADLPNAICRWAILPNGHVPVVYGCLGRSDRLLRTCVEVSVFSLQHHCH